MNEIEILLNVDMYIKWLVLNIGYYMCSMCILIVVNNLLFFFFC